MHTLVGPHLASGRGAGTVGFRMMRGLSLLAVFWAGPALAEGLRYATVFEEHTDGQAEPSSAAETRLVEVLAQKAGQQMVFIDEAQARRIRSTLAASALLEGKIPQVVTTLDADVIIAAVVKAQRADPGQLAGGRLLRYTIQTEARLVAVDTAQVLQSFVRETSATAFSEGAARMLASRKAGEALAEAILEGLKFRGLGGHRLELRIAGLPDVATARHLRERLEQLPGVRGVTMSSVNREQSEVAVELASHQTVALFAEALDASSDTGLQVEGYSARSVQARYVPERALRLGLLVRPARGNAGGSARVVPTLLAQTLGRQSFVALGAGGEPVLGAKGQVKGQLDKLGLPRESSYTLQTRIDGLGSNKIVAATIEEALTGVSVLSEQKTCAAADLARCAVALGETMSERWLGALRDRGRLPKPTARQSDGPLQLKSLTLDPLFAARGAGYGKVPAGKLVITNTGREPLTDLLLTVKLEGFSHRASDQPVDRLNPQETREVLLHLVLEREAAAKVAESQPAVVSVSLSYRLAEQNYRVARAEAVVLHGRNTLDWRAPDSVAAFVTHRHDAVRTAVDDALAQVRKEKHRLARPAALFSVLGGMRYQRDPSHPGRTDELDEVQFPADTLVRRAGDCDDLAVLYAALLQAAGLRSILVMLPGHVVVAVDAGLPLQGLHEFGFDERRVISHGGRLYVPVETTATDQSFEDAWRLGAEVVMRARERRASLGIVDIETAWDTFPPFDLGQAQHPTRIAQRGEVLRKWLESLEAQRLSTLETSLALAERRVAEKANELEGWVRKTRLLWALGRSDAALASAETTVLRFPKSPEAQVALGNLWALSGDAERAVTAYQKALGLTATDDVALRIRLHLNLCTVQQVLGAENGWRESLTEALELLPRGDSAVMDDYLGLMRTRQQTLVTAHDQDSFAQQMRELLYWL